jgi:hypothetical protein
MAGTRCIEWSGRRDKNGYGITSKDKRAHREAWIEANGPIPAGMHVLHHCDNPPCINPEHLFLGTQADNNADMHAKGRYRNGRTKLMADDIAAIRASTEPHYLLAQRYGCCRSNISMIKTGRSHRG